MTTLRFTAAVAATVLLFPLPGCAQDRPVDGGERDGRVGSAASPTSPLEALETGAYDAAVTDFRAAVAMRRDMPASVRGLARALAATGRYEDALDALDEAVAEGLAVESAVARSRADLQRALGRDGAAETAYRAAIAAGADDVALARLGLAELLWERGRRDEAWELFEALAAGYGGAGRSGTVAAESGTAAAATALTYLGTRDPALFHDAVRLYERAIDEAPGDPRPRVALARLFLDKFDSRNAGGLLREALERNPRHASALLAMAELARFDGSPEAFRHVLAALDVNPRYPVAHAFLAELHLELEETEEAVDAAGRALETNPRFLPAWTALAGAAHLDADPAAFAEARDRVLEIDPGHAQLYVTLAEIGYRTRRYADATGFARHAVELDERSWTALAALGMNQLRAGDLEAGRATLETAFEGDPFNLWVKNTLDLLDVLDGFETATSRRFRFKLHPSEAGVLSIYAPLLAEEAFDALQARYGYAPPTPISVEVYDRHADFSVRTVGLAGLGALGVSFGSVLAMDSPGARPTGEFNWGSTLWHEISHAFTLGYTEHRIPRWFSEGLAVLDERHARPGWGHDPDPGFLLAFRAGRLPTLARFDLGFVRPAYRGQVQHAYLLASLLCERIEERHGVSAIRAMLDGYRAGRGTPEVFEAVLGSDVADVERELHTWIEERYATALAAVGSPAGSTGERTEDEVDAATGGEFGALLAQAAAHREAGRQDEAIAALEEARKRFPDYAGPGAPALALARIHAAAGELEAAFEAYLDYTSRNESDLEARIELAGLARELGDAAAERRVLESTVWIEPFSHELRRRLAEAHEAADDWPAAVRERRALAALRPTDMASAWYHLARAQHRAGQATEARSTVLRALEIAPGYDEALDLLLEIRGEAGGGD